MGYALDLKLAAVEAYSSGRWNSNIRPLHVC